MPQLWLNFKDDEGNERKLEVTTPKFFIGRDSVNDLQIRHSSISRKHLQIERFGDIFVAADLGSSNGTSINGQPLSQPTVIKNGDEINCGGAFIIKVEIKNTDEKESNHGDAKIYGSTGRNSHCEQLSDQPRSSSEDAKIAASESHNGFSLFFWAPLLGIVVLVFVAGSLLILQPDEKNRDLFKRPIYSDRNDETSQTNSKESYDDSSTSRNKLADKYPKKNENLESNMLDLPSTFNSNNASVDSSIDSREKIDSSLNSEREKIEKNAVIFAKKLALHESNYVFTRRQVEEIERYVKQLSASSSIAKSLDQLQRNKIRIAQMAESKGLKPQLLAIASIATLETRGFTDVMSNAQSILPVLNELKISLGNELSDDNLLIIAAFEQGKHGDYYSMRNMIEALGREPGVDARKIRTVWYLRERGKISDSQYNLVMKFLAIGTIAQNPRDFGVQAEPLVF
jgi:hypothetical protein